MEEIEINIDPIFQGVCILFAIVGAFWTINSLTQVIVNSSKDKKLAEHFLNKFPLVSPEFINKNAKARDIENNQEIHELNKRVEHLELFVNCFFKFFETFSIIPYEVFFYY